MSRPFFYPSDFKKHEVYTREVLIKIEKYYVTYIEKNNGLIQSLEVEKQVFNNVKKEIKIESQFHAHLIESLFDQFLGAMTFIGQSPKDLIEFMYATTLGEQKNA